VHPTTSTEFTPHVSAQDASVNWDRAVDVGRLEARYVRRCPDYFVVYLSSQTGCVQACRMCHLTASGQTHIRDATFAEMIDQAETVLDYYRRATPPARIVHFNFMARGEPLANRALVADGDGLLGELSRRAVVLGLRPRHLISTIYPREMDRPLDDVFVAHHPDVYYSIYSMSPRFRRRWLPKALPAEIALDRLTQWQRSAQKIVSLHHAYIAGENDSEVDVHQICDAVEERGLMVNVNIVRYNSPDSSRYGVEPDESIVQRNADIYRSRLPQSRVSVIPRVGFDVAASCGMFLGPSGASPT
jgi:adenine C2-methylase RlmN of 23S rRNA A2503 and tRNA A37